MKVDDEYKHCKIDSCVQRTDDTSRADVVAKCPTSPPE